jgi:hypothetical protein
MTYDYGTWYNVKRYINRFKNGQIIKRKRLLKQREFEKKLPPLKRGYHWMESYLQAHMYFSHEYGTVDVYRRYLTKAGYLKRVRQGEYIKVKHIPIRITRRDVQRQGYDVSNYQKGW